MCFKREYRVEGKLWKNVHLSLCGLFGEGVLHCSLVQSTVSPRLKEFGSPVSVQIRGTTPEKASLKKLNATRR